LARRELPALASVRDLSIVASHSLRRFGRRANIVVSGRLNTSGPAVRAADPVAECRGF